MEEEKLTKSQRRALAREEKSKLREGGERTKKVRNWIIGIVLVGGFLFGSYKFVGWINTPQDDLSPVSVEVSSDEWIKGNPDAQTTLIEYSDFQCPACKTYYPLINRLADELGDDLRIVYRHLPLISIHKNALPSARAAEAAGVQGKFWEMHDKLFDKQDDWIDDSKPSDKFEEYAGEIGLDIEKYKGDYESEEVKNAVNSDLASANSLRLSSTPSFFLNGKLIESPRSYEDFKSLIENEIRGYSVE
jgi:protein-disulfide isomerase